MSFSLNEMEATAKRASRGAGYSWGQAEEASKATRWLCAHGLDGAGTLLTLLNLGLSSDPALHRPAKLDGIWRGEGALCPLSAGPLLSDCVHLLETGPVEMHEVAAPALLLPFASYAARTLNCAVAIDIAEVQALTDGVDLSASDLFPAQAQRVIVQQSEAPISPRSRCTRADPASDNWDALTAFARRTYAPATEESRLLGAGAGLSEND